jgi:hypothetical protein
MPQTLSSSLRPDSGLSALTAEIQGESAAALGRSGREVERALAVLAAAGADAPGRPALLQAAADAVWSYFIQREACGVLNHDQAVVDYAIPREVLARVGARP